MRGPASQTSKRANKQGAKGLFGTAYNRILDGEKRADEKIPPNARRFSRFCQTQRQQNTKFVLRPVKSGKRLLARFSVPRVPSKRVSWTRKQTGPMQLVTKYITRKGCLLLYQFVVPLNAASTWKWVFRKPTCLLRHLAQGF